MTCAYCDHGIPHARTPCPDGSATQRADQLVQIATVSGGLLLAGVGLVVGGFLGWVIGFWSGATVGFLLGQVGRLLR